MRSTFSDLDPTGVDQAFPTPRLEKYRTAVRMANGKS